MLLGLKKIRFGAGKHAGIGGSVEAGETPEGAAVRELAEEIGVRVKEADLQPRGRAAFLFPDRPAWNQRVHVYVVTRWEGEPAENGEMRPGWFPLSALPLDRMWPDAAFWLPAVLAGKTVALECVYAEGGTVVAEVRSL